MTTKLSLASWNMQGGNDGKWSMARLVKAHVDFLFLQECGASPHTVDRCPGVIGQPEMREQLRAQQRYNLRPRAVNNLFHLEWGVLAREGDRAVNKRCSMGIYHPTMIGLFYPDQRVLPLEAVIVDESERRRPAIGIRYSFASRVPDEWFHLLLFNTHAPASGGAIDYAERMFSWFDALALHYKAVGWICGGDFNCNPTTLAEHLNAKNAARGIFSPPSATHKSADGVEAILDYFVVSRPGIPVDIGPVEIVDGLNWSDHQAVWATFNLDAFIDPNIPHAAPGPLPSLKEIADWRGYLREDAREKRAQAAAANSITDLGSEDKFSFKVGSSFDEEHEILMQEKMLVSTQEEMRVAVKQRRQKRLQYGHKSKISSKKNTKLVKISPDGGYDKKNIRMVVNLRPSKLR